MPPTATTRKKKKTPRKAAPAKKPSRKTTPRRRGVVRTAMLMIAIVVRRTTRIVAFTANRSARIISIITRKFMRRFARLIAIIAIAITGIAAFLVVALIATWFALAKLEIKIPINDYRMSLTTPGGVLRADSNMLIAPQMDGSVMVQNHLTLLNLREVVNGILSEFVIPNVQNLRIEKVEFLPPGTMRLHGVARGEWWIFKTDFDTISDIRFAPQNDYIIHIEMHIDINVRNALLSLGEPRVQRMLNEIEKHAIFNLRAVTGFESIRAHKLYFEKSTGGGNHTLQMLVQVSLADIYSRLVDILSALRSTRS